MTTFFVTRHSGAREWAARHGFAEALPIEHLDPGQVARGDIVVGTLPIQLVADVVERGARYLHLVLDLERADRGRDLSAQDMERVGARLTPMTAAYL